MVFIPKLVARRGWDSGSVIRVLSKIQCQELGSSSCRSVFGGTGSLGNNVEPEYSQNSKFVPPEIAIMMVD